MVGIRTDANTIIATGHMMRCITIAKSIVSMGGSVTFFIADEESEILLKKNLGDLNDVSVVVLHTAWDDLINELPVLIEQLQLRNVDTLLVDSYKVTYDYFKAVDRVCKTAYIDDLHEGIFPVDILINYSGYHYVFDYASDYERMHGHKDEPTKLLLGLMYAPLREQFHTDVAAGMKRSGEVKDILLACGGADTQNMILPMLEVICDRGLNTDGMNWHTVVGDYVDNAEAIEAFASMHEGITIHRSVKNMASLMRSCDIAVVAAGTMLTECAAVRLPAVFYQVADNQRYGVDYWRQPGRMIYAGDVTQDKDMVIAAIVKEVMRLIHDHDLIIKITEGLSGITDGRGAERIANALKSEG